MSRIRASKRRLQYEPNEFSTVTATIVVAMGSDGVIGVDGGMPWHLPADLAHFKRITLGHPMIMGRRTYESIGRPLPGRTTVVVTGQDGWNADGVEVEHSLEAALDRAHALDGEVFIVGGAQIYRQALAHGLVDRLVVTHIKAAPAGDTYFPDLDWTEWVEREREHHTGSPSFDIAIYVRRSVADSL